jgi:hypothetical protein
MKILQFLSLLWRDEGSADAVEYRNLDCNDDAFALEQNAAELVAGMMVLSARRTS